MGMFTTSLQWAHLFEPFSIILNVIERKNPMKCVHEKLIEMLASIKNPISFNLDRTCATKLPHTIQMIFAFLIYEDAAPNLNVWIYFYSLFDWIAVIWAAQPLWESAYLYSLIVGLDQHHDHWHGDQQTELKK